MEKKLQVLNSGKSYNCYSGSVCYLLNNMGTILSEATSFGLSGGLGFIVNCDEVISFSCVREKHCLTEYLISLGVRVAELPMNDYVWIKNYIQMSVNKKEPVMLRYDGFYLPFTPIYKSKHDVRIGLITGYGDGYFYMTDFVYEVINYRISEEDFQKAIFSEKCEKDIFEMFIVTTPDNIEQKVTKESVKSASSECVDFFLDSTSSLETLLGLDGIRRFAEDLENYINRMFHQDDWDKIFIDLKQASIAIRNYSYFYKEIKKNNLTDFDEITINKIFNYFKEASEQWDYFCNCITVYKLTKNSRYLEKMKKILNLFEESLKEGFILIRKN